MLSLLFDSQRLDAGTTLLVSDSRSDAKATPYTLPLFDGSNALTTNIHQVSAPFLRPPQEEDIALLLTTSGTTGVPKGVPLSHGNLRAQAEILVDA